MGPAPRGRGRRGHVRTSILALLAEQPLNGYQIMQTLAERTDGAWKPSPGAVYPALSQLEDEGLIARLAAEQMTLTVCPLSNLKLCVVKDLKDHPVPEMLRRGLHVTLNSDDPSYFGGYVNANYARLAEATGLTREQLTQMAVNSFEGSFLPDAEKADRIAEVRAYAAAI